MSNERYYTPKLKEFCVGFEYEYQVLPNGTFFSKVFNYFDELELRSWVEISAKYPEILAPIFYRVKYIDKEDIESLGWKVRKEPYIWQFVYNSGRYMLITDIYSKNEDVPIPQPNKGSIKIKDMTDDYVLFYGYLKNKNELSRIMKQLNII